MSAGAPAVAVAELRERLTRQFRTVVSEVAVGSASFELLHPANADDLISEADYVKDERLPYWADIWPSSRALAGRIAGLRGGGKQLLELGCGMGLVASAAARSGFDVVATDYYEDALLFTQVNVFTNAGLVPETRYVDWRAFPKDLEWFDYVIASDVLYEKEYAPLLADAFAQTLASGGLGIVADPGRIGAEEFLAACAERSLDVKRAARVPHVDGTIRQTIDLYEIRTGPAARRMRGR